MNKVYTFNFSKRGKIFHILLGLFTASLTYILIPGAVYPMAPLTAAMIALMAIWWITEVIPIAITSLVPLIVLPLIGLKTTAEVGAYYGKPIIFLFLGGFILALGIQRSGLHRRIALSLLQIVGDRPAGILLGFMCTSAALSMWISNTAAVLVLFPICLSVIDQISAIPSTKKLVPKLATALMLGIAYAADIGGMSTIIGTPPNMVFIEIFSELYPKAPEIGFLQWMLMGIPLSIAFLFCGWILLSKLIFRLGREKIFEGNDVLKRKMDDLGAISRDELITGLIFLSAALLWMTGSDLYIQDLHIKGWRNLLSLEYLSDASVAIAMASLLFLVPSKKNTGESLLNWKYAKEGVPWGILLLFGGGLALAGSFQASGLSDMVGNSLSGESSNSPISLVLGINTGLTFLTEITSNTAMANLVLPILGKAAVALETDPRLLMIPATLSASCAFMMPIASPTQAIVFGSGKVSIKQMVKAGLWFNLLGIVLVTVVFFIIGLGVFDIDPSNLPLWAK